MELFAPENYYGSSAFGVFEHQWFSAGIRNGACNLGSELFELLALNGVVDFAG